MFLGAASPWTSSTARMTTCRTTQQQPLTQHCRYTSTNLKVNLRSVDRSTLDLLAVDFLTQC